MKPAATGLTPFVVPETARLEFDRKQLELVHARRGALQSAYATLEQNGVGFSRVDPEELIQPPDLIGLARQIGGNVDVVEPTLEDYQDAHRRACLHEQPHPPDIKSDEMRDLIIWVMSLRLSRGSDGAVLVSRDVVHTHARGDTEAFQARLTRAHSPEDALECLEVQTPAGTLIQTVLASAWSQLRAEGLPLAKEPTLRAVADPVFVEGVAGLDTAECKVQIVADSGAVLTAMAVIKINPDGTETVRLADIRAGGDTLNDLEVNAPSPFRANQAGYTERLMAFRELLGEDQ